MLAILSQFQCVKMASNPNLLTTQLLTQWGLLMPYGTTELGQHWWSCWIQHQAITWTYAGYLQSDN